MNNLQNVLENLQSSAKFDESIDINLVLQKVPSNVIKVDIAGEVDKNKVILISNLPNITEVRNVTEKELDVLDDKQVKKLLKGHIILIEPTISQKIIRTYGKWLSKLKIKPYILRQNLERTIANIPATKKITINKNSLCFKVGKLSTCKADPITFTEITKGMISEIKQSLVETNANIKIKKILLKTTMGKKHAITE